MQFTGYAFLTQNRNQSSLVQPSQVGSASDRHEIHAGHATTVLFQSLKWVQPPIDQETALIATYPDGFQSLKWVQPPIDAGVRRQFR